MCWWNNNGSSDNTSYQSSATSDAKKETAKSKARLLGTEGGNKGSELSAGQSQSVRRIFG